MNKGFKLISQTLIVGLTCIGLLLGYLYHKNKVNSNRNLLETKLNNLFEGKIAISDGSKMAFEGEFLDKRRMHYSFLRGGFTVYELTKESDGYVKTTSNSGDLYFKESESLYVPPQYFSDGSKAYGGYNRSNYRPSVQKCYDGAFNFLLKGSENDRKLSYTPDKLTEIKNFPNGYKNDLHFLKQQTHPTESYFTSNGEGTIYSNVYELKYNQEKEYYAITEKKGAINSLLIISLIVGGTCGLLLAILINLILKSFSPHKGNHFDILSVKWRNTIDNSILTIDPKTLGKYPVTLVENNIPKKGNAKIKDNDIEIVFPNAEYYYQIVKKDKDILELKDLTNEQTIIYEKLGSNALSNRTESELNEKDKNQNQEFSTS